MLCGLLGCGFLFDAKPLKQFIIPITFTMVYPMMVTLNLKSVFRGHDVKLQLTTQFINFVIIPLIVFSLGKIFLSGSLEKYGLWAVGLFLIGVLPASGMTIALLISLAYVIQIQSAAWYVKLVPFLFGSEAIKDGGLLQPVKQEYRSR